MAQNNRNHLSYEFLENSVFLLLRVVLFIAFLILLFKNTDKWWIYALTTGALLVLVMFKKLDFFEIFNFFKAGINFDTHGETSSGTSFTPEEVIRDLKQPRQDKIIKSEFPKEESKNSN